MKKYLFLILMLFAIQIGYSQTANENYSKGLDEFNNENPNYENAKDCFNKAIELDPNGFSTYDYYARRGFCFYKLKDYKQAERDFDKSISLKSDYFRVYKYKSYLAKENKDYKLEIELLEKALSLNPNDYESKKYREEAKKNLNYSQSNNRNNTIANNDFYILGLNEFNKENPSYEKAIVDFHKAIEVDPNGFNTYDYYARRGFCFYILKDYKQAERDFDKSISLKSDYFRVYRYKSYLAQENNNYNLEIELLSKAISLNSIDGTSYKNRGIANYLLNNYKEAILDFNKSIKLDPKDAEAYYYSGFAKSKLKKYLEAIEDYDKLIELEPKNAISYSNRGSAKAELKKYLEAIEDYDKSIELDPEESLTFNNRGHVKGELGLFQDAIFDFDKAILLDSNKEDYYDNRGVSKLNLKKYKEAKIDFEKSISLNPNKNDNIAMAHKSIVEVLLNDNLSNSNNNKSNTKENNSKNKDKNLQSSNEFYKKGLEELDKENPDYKLALDNFSKAIKLDPKGDNVYDYYARRGFCYYKQFDDKKADKDFDKSISLKPDYFRVYRYKAYLAQVNYNYNLKIELLSTAIGLNPNDTSSYLHRGDGYFSIRNYKASILDYDKYISLTPISDPNLYNSYNNRGRAKNELGLYKEAIEDYDKSIELNDKNKFAYMNRGDANYKLSNFQESIEDYDKDSEKSGYPYRRFYLKGMAKYYLNQYQGAIDDFEKCDPRISLFEEYSKPSEIILFYEALKDCYNKIGASYVLIPKSQYFKININHAYWNSKNNGKLCCMFEFSVRIENKLPIKITNVSFDLILEDKQSNIVYRKNHKVYLNILSPNEVIQSEYFNLNNEVCLACSYINGNDFSRTTNITGVSY